MTARTFQTFLAFVLLILAVAPLALSAQSNFENCDPRIGSLTLHGPGRNWQFLDAVGPHSAILGREDGNFEVWVFPLKLFRDFHLTFRASDHVIPAEALPHSVIVRPESSLRSLRI